MSTVETVLLSLLVLDAAALIVLVLIQQGKGADVGAAFGSGSANTVFGSSGGGSFLTKVTAWLAITFFVITFGLAYVAKQRADSAGTLGIPTIENVEEVPAAGSDDPPSSDIPAVDTGLQDADIPTVIEDATDIPVVTEDGGS
ncbi:MAG: preprotein translocase subunit SecG [Pseudomonadota bacterium]